MSYDWQATRGSLATDDCVRAQVLGIEIIMDCKGRLQALCFFAACASPSCSDPYIHSAPWLLRSTEHSDRKKSVSAAVWPFLLRPRF